MEKKPEPTTENQQMPATEPEPSASSFPETKPAFLSDLVCELVFTSVPVGVLVELDDEVRRYRHPPASGLNISKSGWINFLMTSCAMQDFPPPLVPSGPKYSSSPLVLPSFKSSTTSLVLPRSKLFLLLMVPPSLLFPPSPSKPSSSSVSAMLIPYGSSAPPPTQTSDATMPRASHDFSSTLASRSLGSFVLPALQLHWAPSYLRLHLGQSSICLHHGLPGLRLHLVSQPLWLLQAPPSLWLCLNPHFHGLCFSPPISWLHLGRSSPWFHPTLPRCPPITPSPWSVSLSTLPSIIIYQPLSSWLDSGVSSYV